MATVNQSDVGCKENPSPQLTGDTSQEKSSPQGSANRGGCHDASEHLESLMTQMMQKQAQEMQQNVEAMCTKYRKQKDGTIMRLEAEIKEVRQWLMQSDTRVTSLTEEKREQKAENDKLRKNLASLEAEKQKLEADIKELRQCLMLSETSITTLTREKCEQKAKNDKLIVDISCLRKQNQCLQDDVLNANCELRAEVDKVLELRKENDRLNKRMAYLCSKHDATTQKLREKIERVETLTRRKQALSEALEEEMKKTKALEVKVQEYSASIIDLVGERNVLHDQIGELHGSVQKETQKVTGLEEDLMQVLQQLQGVAKYASGVHAQLMQDLKPHTLDVAQAVSGEGNTVDVGLHQLTCSGLHELPQLPANLPDVTMDILVFFAAQMGGKWDSIAYALGVGQLATLLAQSYQPADSKCLTVLQTWIEQGTEVTWQKLLDALWGLGLRSTAISICEKLKEYTNDH